MESRQTRPSRMNPARKLALIPLFLALIVFIAITSFDVVPVGSTGILLTFGHIQDGSALNEGLHMHLPMVQSIVTMNNRVQKLELATEAFSKDIQTVNAILAVNYQLRPEKSFSVYKNYGKKYESNIITPATHEVLKSVCSQYTAEELIAKRAQSSDAMRDELNEKLQGIGITVIDFNIIDFDFSEEFINAVEAKQVAEQVKKKAATENETAIAQAEREKQVAIKRSEAEAEKLRIEAEAKANATKIAAEAEAYRLKQINENITEKTILSTIAEHWDGVLPKIFGGTSANIIDAKSLFGETSPEIGSGVSEE